MKAMILAIGLLTCGLASASTVNLRLPTVFQMTGHACGFNGTHVVVGSESWSADGNYFTLTAQAYTMCSSGGRGSRGSYWFGGETVTYDLSGNVVAAVKVPYVVQPYYPQGTTVYFANPVNPAYTVELYHYVNIFDVVTLLGE